MRNQPASFHFEDEDIRCYVEREVVIIQIKQNAFEIVTDLTESNHLFDALTLAEQHPDIRMIFIYNNPDCFNEAAYETYLKKVLSVENGPEREKLTPNERRGMRRRQINILNHFILRAVGSHKLIVVGLQGCVVSPFFGASLAADLRFAADSLSFCLPHIRYGIHPAGALPYFLPRYLGLSRAKDLLLRGGTIPAKNALKLGLVNQLFDARGFPDHCLNELQRIKPSDPTVIKLTKQLLNMNEEEIEHYFEHEAKVTNF